jgi:hypothetical protein
MVDSRTPLAEIGGALDVDDEEAVTLAHDLVSRGLLELVPKHEVEEQMLRAIVDSYNHALNCIYGSLEDDGARVELTKLGRDFIAGRSHGNKTLQEIALADNGRLNYFNVRSIYETIDEPDPIKLVVIVLTRYLSFVLFCAIENLPQHKQDELQGTVNAALAEILAATQ